MPICLCNSHDRVLYCVPARESSAMFSHRINAGSDKGAGFYPHNLDSTVVSIAVSNSMQMYAAADDQVLFGCRYFFCLQRIRSVHTTLTCKPITKRVWCPSGIWRRQLRTVAAAASTGLARWTSHRSSPTWHAVIRSATSCLLAFARRGRTKVSEASNSLLTISTSW